MNIFQKQIALLRDLNFRFFILDAILTFIGRSMSYIVITWYVISINNHLSQVIYVSLAFWIPAILFSLLSGIIVDCYPRKNVIIISNIIRILAFMGIASLLPISNYPIYLCYQ